MIDETNAQGEGETCECPTECNLPPDEFKDRLAMIRRDILPLTTRRQKLATGSAFEFHHTPSLEKTLHEFIEFERTCCSGLRWGLGRLDTGDLRLTIEGVPAGSSFFETIDGVEPPTAPSIARRLGQSLGLGAGAALFLCCVVPAAMTALTGGAVAAWIAGLDNPLVIAGVGVVLAVVTWFFLNRAAGQSSCGC